MSARPVLSCGKRRRSTLQVKGCPSVSCRTSPPCCAGPPRQSQSAGQRSGGTTHAHAEAGRSSRNAAAPDRPTPSAWRPPRSRVPFHPGRTQSEKNDLIGGQESRRITESDSPTKFSVFGYEEGCVWGANSFSRNVLPDLPTLE